MWFKKRKPTAAAEVAREKSPEAVLVATGWQRVLDYSGAAICPRDRAVEFYRPEWDSPVIQRYSEFHPEMNIAGLFWR